MRKDAARLMRVIEGVNKSGAAVMSRRHKAYAAVKKSLAESGPSRGQHAELVSVLYQRAKIDDKVGRNAEAMAEVHGKLAAVDAEKQALYVQVQELAGRMAGIYRRRAEVMSGRPGKS